MPKFMFLPKKTDYALNLNECHNRVLDLFYLLDKIPESTFPISTNFIGDSIIETAEKITDQYCKIDEIEYTLNLKFNLSEGIRFVRLIKNFYKNGELVTKENIYSHLQHPINIFFGDFLKKQKKRSD